MGSELGRKVWIFPDTELPRPGDSLLKGHESIIVLNMNRAPVTIVMTMYFTDRDPVQLPPLPVAAEKVRCIRLDNEAEIGFKVPLETQYAVKLTADRPVVVQYGRLDPRQTNLAYYTTMGYSV